MVKPAFVLTENNIHIVLKLPRPSRLLKVSYQSMSIPNTAKPIFTAIIIIFAYDRVRS